MFRCCAAASAKDRNAQFCESSHCLCKVIRQNGECSRNRVRQASIRLYNDRQGCPAADFFNHGQQLLRPQRTVYAKGIHTQPLQCQCHCRNGAACEGSAVFFKGHRDKDRLVTVFLCSQYSSFRFIEVGHGFNDNEVSIFSGFDFLPKNVISFLEFQRAKRL